MTITMLFLFVPGALWGFVAMPWYGWIALGFIGFGGAVVVGEYGCSHGPPDGFCMSEGFPLLAATCVAWLFAAIAADAYSCGARDR